MPLLQGVEGGDAGDFSRCTSGHGLLDSQAVRNVGMARGLALLQGKLAILALHDLELLIVRASRQLLLAAGAPVKRHPTHGAGLQHGAESVHQLVGRFLMACKVNARKLLAKLGEARLPFYWRELPHHIGR